MSHQILNNSDYKTEILNAYNALKEQDILAAVETCSGWYPLINSMVFDVVLYCTSNAICIPEFTQIKQKFAELRVYYFKACTCSHDNSHYNAIRDIIDKYVTKSSSICEYTGLNGVRFTKNGVIRVLHPEIIEKLNKIKSKNYYDAADAIIEKYQVKTYYSAADLIVDALQNNFQAK